MSRSFATQLLLLGLLALSTPSWGRAESTQDGTTGYTAWMSSDSPSELPSTMALASCSEPSLGLPCDDSGCDSCGPCLPACECGPWWAHRTGVFGELLYLSPGNSDIIYAREQTDPQVAGSASPTGPMGILNLDESAGYRVGLSLGRDDCSSIVVSFARWDGETDDAIAAGPTNVLDPVLLHPSTLTVGATGVESIGHQSLSFQNVDLSYRHIARATACSVINWTAGMRYGNLEQGLLTDQTIGVATGLTQLHTDIDFDGFGLLAGLDGERRHAVSGGLLYGKAIGSLLGGNWTGYSEQLNQFGGGVIASDYQDFRVTPVLEAEVGVGWQSSSGNVRMTCGYLTSGWFNAISTRDYLQSFNEGNFVDMSDTLSFSGLTCRLELRK